MTSNPYTAAPYSPSESTSTARIAPGGNRKLKTSTKTFAIVLLVLGIFNIFGALFAIFFLAIGNVFLSFAAERGQDEDLRRAAEQMNGAVTPLSLSLLAISGLLAVGLIIGSIGTLRRRLRGAQLLRWCAGLMAVLTLCQSSYQIFLMPSAQKMIMEDMEKNMQKNMSQAPEGMETFMNGVFVVQMVFAVLFALLFFALYLWAFLHFSKESTREQFEPSLEGGGSKP